MLIDYLVTESVGNSSDDDSSPKLIVKRIYFEAIDMVLEEVNIIFL